MHFDGGGEPARLPNEAGHFPKFFSHATVSYRACASLTTNLYINTPQIVTPMSSTKIIYGTAWFVSERPGIDVRR